MFPQIFGKYVLEREIAAGGMARVYEATLRGAGGFEKRLVVKQIRPELASDQAFVDRFVEEAKTTVELSHPNIVPVYELGVEKGVYFIAMELCEGVTLAEILRETGRLSPEEGAYLGAEICRALDYAHRRAAVVHRDVTPRNVLVDEEGAVRLIDFGIAAPAGASRETHHDGEGEPLPPDVLGSPGHMPPEQIAGKKLTPETDVFAVGALLVEAWTSRPPFRRATVAECERALSAPLAPPSRDDARLAPLDDVIARALRLDRKERPASAEELARPLRDFLRATDAGDIARRLGERARRARARSGASGAWILGERSGDDLLDELEAESRLGETQTFATRELEASGSGAAPPEPASGPSTRKLPDEPDEAGVDRRREVGTRRLASVPPPITGSEPAPPDAPPRRSVAWAAAGLVAAVLALVALWPDRGERAALDAVTGARAGAGTAASAPGVRPSALHPSSSTGATGRARAVGSGERAITGAHLGPVGSAAEPTGPASASAARSPTGAPRSPPSAAGGTVPSAAGGTALGPAAGLGTLTVTSDPSGMPVSAGARSGVTPLTVQLPEGTHGVGVTFRATGERASTNVRLVGGGTVRVHADFTGATPRVYHR